MKRGLSQGQGVFDLVVAPVVAQAVEVAMRKREIHALLVRGGGHIGDQLNQSSHERESYFPPAPFRYLSSSDSVDSTSTDFASMVFSRVSSDFKKA